MLGLSLLEEHVTSPYFTITTIIIFLAISLVLILLKWSSFSSKKSGLAPPSPLTLPIIGNLHQLGLYPHHSFRKLAEIYGPIMLLHLGSVPALIISSADMAREIMKTHDIIFSDRPKSKINQITAYGQKDIAVAPYGEYWRQMKSIAVVHLLSNKRVQSYKDVREEETNLMIDHIKSSSSLPVNLSEIFANTTNDIVCRVALGRKYRETEGGGGGGRSFRDLLREGGEIFGLFNVGDFIPWLDWIGSVKGSYARAEKVAKELDEFFERVVDEHVANGNWRAESKNKDLVDVLLWIQEENMAGFPIEKTSIKAIILDVFGAGTDTTYTALDWVMAEVLRHPEVMKKLQNEIREIAKNKSEITEDDLNKIPYIKAVIQEALRLHPPLPLLVPRVSTQDVKVKGFNIAAGTQVFINAYAIGRDPAIWDRAEEFVPERFLNNTIDFKGQNFELIPFGSGRRICPGIQFAMSTDELALAKLMYKFDWELHGVATTLQDMDMSETTGLTAHRKLPLLAVATPYLSS
ncbi:cytochrome P450 736A117-like [Euphorbia lathyris]|uniref:cytochrome P450 736A117-like n=1 Tax=Euphorbia lathyris TaxID=212925 RepID=UPI003313B63A